MTSNVGNWLLTFKPKQLEYYQGKLIHADTGLHDQVGRLVQRFVPAGSSVLDVGAGAGAFSRRLLDMQYVVTALDHDPDKWDCPGVPFHRVDVNGEHLSDSVAGPFDAACCLEVIEHVENPWKLLRDISSILKPGGHLILSTPNITSFLSRLIFFRTGRFHQFDESDLSYGHISPITNFELSVIAQRTGWRILEVAPGGYLPVFDFSSLGARSLAVNALRGLAYVAASGHKRGWALLYVMENGPT